MNLLLFTFGKPLVQARIFYVEYSEECGIVHAHFLVEHEYAVNIETQARSIFIQGIFQHTYMTLISVNGICGNGIELIENIIFVYTGTKQ